MLIKSSHKQKPSPVGEGVEAMCKLSFITYFVAETDEVSLFFVRTNLINCHGAPFDAAHYEFKITLLYE